MFSLYVAVCYWNEPWCFFLVEPIFFHKSSGIVLGGRMRPAPLRESEVIDTLPFQQTRMTIIAFDAARFVINPVLLFVLPGVLDLGRPRTRPHCRILDRD